MLAQIMSAFVMIIVAVSLYPLIVEQVQSVAVQQNATSTSSEFATMALSTLPLFFAIAMGVAILGVVITTLKGFSDYSEDYEEENEDIPAEEKPHKQTYLEYVKERIAAQKLIHNS